MLVSLTERQLRLLQEAVETEREAAQDTLSDLQADDPEEAVRQEEYIAELEELEKLLEAHI